MKALFTIGLIAIGTLFGGCSTPSLNPLATKDTITTDAGFVGTWRVKNDAEQYTITDAGDQTYKVVVTPDEKDKKPMEFGFQLVKLGEHQFIDMTVTKAAHDEIGERFGTVVIPMHLFMKAKRTGDSIQVWSLDDDWLKESLANGKLVLPHGLYGENKSPVITASTEELQAFFAKHATNDKLFKEGGVLERSTAAKVGDKPKKAK